MTETADDQQAPRQPAADKQTPSRVECPATKDPAVRVFIMAAMALAFGLWCAYDAYVLDKYPYGEAVNEMASWAFNHFLPVVLVPVGLILLVKGVLMLRRVLVADAEGIGYVGKSKIAWGEVTELDASDLADKKILRLSGTDRTLVLDSWKLQNFPQLVAVVEAHVPREKWRT